MTRWKDLQGVNLGFALELYERFLKDPGSVDAETRAFFEQHPPPGDSPARAATVSGAGFEQVVGAVNLAESIRKFGHMDARVDPLGSAPPGDPSLRAESHGVTEEILEQLPAALLAGPISDGASNFLEVIRRLRRVYSSTLGYDFAHLRDPEERAWLLTAAEAGLYRAPADPVDEQEILERLTQVECFERFLHRTFPGKTRFSIEGLDMLVPVLDEVIGEAAEIGMRHALIGMAHRGRVNVLAHILNKPYSEILAEFKDPVRARNFREDQGWTGDVKYHLGARRAIKGGEEVGLIISLPPNPSHLEAADPVVEGMARAAGTRADRRGAPVFDSTRTLPILIHGDAAFAGQGVVPETLNFYHLEGYRTGGTIHIIADNQIGYTTAPNQYRSALYASGIARGFRIPIAHVSADDPEACIEVARVAFAFRAHFKKDFVINLLGYRRHGHNEGDEPSFTQPLLYQKIAAHPTVRELYATQLVKDGVIPQADADAILVRAEADLDRITEQITELAAGLGGTPREVLDRLAGTVFGLTAEPTERLLVESLVADLGGTPMWVPEEMRTLYHAGLAHGANHLVTLVTEAMEILSAAGAADPAGTLRPLLTAALDNALEQGDAALTGPIVRGDLGTVRAHLEDITANAPATYTATYQLQAAPVSQFAARRG